MSGTKRKFMDERKLRLLKYLSDNADESGCFTMSVAHIANDLGLSVTQLKYLRRSLVAEGLLMSEARFLPNGGQLENSYSLTEEGLACLDGSVKPV